MTDKMNKDIRIKKEHKKYLEKRRLLFKSNLEQMQIAYSNNETKKLRK